MNLEVATPSSFIQSFNAGLARSTPFPTTVTFLAIMPGAEIPPEVLRLFWDVDPATIDLGNHADYVMERVMARGGWVPMKWLRSTYSKDAIADFLARKGASLAPREHAYWALIAGVAAPARRGGARPPWAGP
jgi:uncharacterized protein DUF6922